MKGGTTATDFLLNLAAMDMGLFLLLLEILGNQPEEISDSFSTLISDSFAAETVLLTATNDVNNFLEISPEDSFTGHLSSLFTLPNFDVNNFLEVSPDDSFTGYLSCSLFVLPNFGRLGLKQKSSSEISPLSPIRESFARRIRLVVIGTKLVSASLDESTLTLFSAFLLLLEDFLIKFIDFSTDVGLFSRSTGELDKLFTDSSSDESSFIISRRFFFLLTLLILGCSKVSSPSANIGSDDVAFNFNFINNKILVYK